MKAFRALLLAPLFLAAPALHSQEAPSAPAQPAPELPAGPAPSKTDLTPAEDVPVKPPMDASAPKLDLMPAEDTTIPPAESTLIPEMIEPVEKPQGTEIPQPTKPAEPANRTAIAANLLETLVRFRNVQNRVVKEPAVQAEWDTSESARTDYEKRAALRRYYQLLYARMEKIDGSLKPLIEERREVALRRLRQHKIDPTQPPYGVTPEPEEVVVVKADEVKKKGKSKKKSDEKRKPHF